MKDPLSSAATPQLCPAMVRCYDTVPQSSSFWLWIVTLQHQDLHSIEIILIFTPPTPWGSAVFSSPNCQHAFAAESFKSSQVIPAPPSTSLPPLPQLCTWLCLTFTQQNQDLHCAEVIQIFPLSHCGVGSVHLLHEAQVLMEFDLTVVSMIQSAVAALIWNCSLKPVAIQIFQLWAVFSPVTWVAEHDKVKSEETLSRLGRLQKVPRAAATQAVSALALVDPAALAPSDEKRQQLSR